MPPKPKKPKHSSYSHEDLLRAIDAVKGGERVNMASKKYGIPQSTLDAKIRGINPIERRMGPQPVLGEFGEGLLVKWIQALAERGFPIKKSDLITSAQQVAADLSARDGKIRPRIGKKWLALFLKRHPEVSERTVEKLSKVRAEVKEKDIRSWYTNVTNYLDDQGVADILNDPNRIYNLDESGFFLCAKSGKVLAMRGQKNVYEVHAGNDKENLTVLCTVSANGLVPPVQIVYPAKRFPPLSKLSMPDEWVMSKSESGWMNGENFYEYVANYFVNFVKKSGAEFPIILFLDGHKSHLTYHLSKFCSENGVILIALPPNCTHVMQPLDVAVFSPVKKEWANAVHKWRMEKGLERLTKYNFPPLLKEVLDKRLTVPTITNGFRRCGLYPFDPEQVDYSKVDLNKPKSLRSEDCHLTEGSQSTEESHGRLRCLQWFETFISPEVLEQFNETYAKFTPIWLGDLQDQSLYVLWKKAKDSLIVESEKERHVDPLSSTSHQCQNEEPTHSTSVSTENKQQTPTKNSGEKDAQETPCIAGAEIHCSGEAQSSQEKLAKVLSPQTNGKNVPSPFKNNLFWPGSPPKTKGKGMRKPKIHLPAVISSKEWQAYEEKRIETKQLEENKKAERKRLREQKQQSKKTCKKRKTVYDEEEDWTCKVCSKRYSAELILNIRRRWIECDDCKNTYHYKCIPKKHLDAFGLEEDDEEDEDVQFLCHQCAKDVDSDIDPFDISEESDEE